jgi:hypothetical protein
VSESISNRRAICSLARPSCGQQQRLGLHHLAMRQHRRVRHPRQLSPLLTCHQQPWRAQDRHASDYRIISQTDH